MMNSYFFLFFFMFHSLWKAALARPVMSSMVGLAIGTASSLTVASIQPQPTRSSWINPGTRIAQTAPEPGSPSGGAGFSGQPPQRDRLQPPPGGGGEGGGGFRQPPPEGMREPEGGFRPNAGPGGFGGPGRLNGERGPETNQQGGPQGEFHQGQEGGTLDNRGNDNERRMNEFDQSKNQEEQERRMAEEEARQEAQQKRQEAMQKQQEERSLQMMKKGMAQAARGVAQMKKYFDKTAAKGVAVPAECAEALTKIQTTVDAIKNAANFEDAQDADPESMRDNFETLNECRQKVEMLAQIPNILKRVDKEIKNMERNWTRTKKNAPADAQDAVSDGDTILQSIKDARKKIADLAKSGDIEELKGLLEDEIYGRFDDLGGVMQRVEAARNAKRFVAEFTRRIREAERMVIRLKKHGDDTAQLEELVLQAKQLYAQIKGMKVGSDEWEDAVEQLAELGEEFAKATGGDVNVDEQFKGPRGAGGPPPMVNFPQF